METLIGDLRHALRVLRHSPGFAATAIAVLALGIGATTAIFSTVNAALLRPLPFPEPQDLFAVYTPATDGRHVFVTFLDTAPDRDARAVVSCYDFDGRLVWQKSAGRFSSAHGFCSSPVLHGNLVILNCDHDAAPKADPSYVVALDRQTGKEVWRTERPNRTRSYCTPILIRSPKSVAAIVTAFWPRVNPDAKRRTPSFNCEMLVTGTSAISERHVHDVVVGRCRLREQGRRDLGVE